MYVHPWGKSSSSFTDWQVMCYSLSRDIIITWHHYHVTSLSTRDTPLSCGVHCNRHVLVSGSQAGLQPVPWRIEYCSYTTGGGQLPLAAAWLLLVFGGHLPAWCLVEGRPIGKARGREWERGLGVSRSAASWWGTGASSWGTWPLHLLPEILDWEIERLRTQLKIN